MIKNKMDGLLKWATQEYAISTGSHRHYCGGYVQAIRDMITIYEAYGPQSLATSPSSDETGDKT